MNMQNTHFGAGGGGLFALGSVVGARSWKVTEDGFLRSVHRDHVWVPGRNDAECLRFKSSPYQYGSPMVFDRFEPHGDSSEFFECQCGFYGYFDGSNDYYRPGRVAGMIEGFGETVIGTRGFRAMRAVIVALTFPDDVGLDAWQVDAIRVNYPGVPVFDTFERMVAEFAPTDPTDEVTAPGRGRDV